MKFDELYYMFSEKTSSIEKGIKNKSKETGISYSILKQVFDRGMAAWKTGHRPGTTPEQWGYARINSFATGGKTQKTADADLWKKHKKQLKENEEYNKGVDDSTADKRNSHFKKNAKKEDDDPSAYKPAPGDIKTKTKLSKYTKEYKKRFKNI